MCDCYIIGGPWIAEDPNCPVHGREAVREREAKEQEADEMEARIVDLETRIKELEELVGKQGKTIKNLVITSRRLVDETRRY